MGQKEDKNWKEGISEFNPNNLTKYLNIEKYRYEQIKIQNKLHPRS